MSIADDFRTSIGAVGDNWVPWHHNRGAVGADSVAAFYRRVTASSGNVADLARQYWSAPTTGRFNATSTVSGNAVRLEGPDWLTAAPLLIYCHGQGGTQNEPWTLDFAPLRTPSIDAGWIWAASNMAGANFGNAAGVTSISQLIAWVKTHYTVTDIVLYGVSMGGLPAMNYIANGGYDPLLRGFVGGVAGQSLADLFNNVPSTKAAIKTAWGFAADGDYGTATAGGDPMLRTTSLYAGLRYCWFASFEDTLLSPTPHSVAMRDKLASVATEATLQTTTGDHVTTPMTASGTALAPVFMSFLGRCAPA